MTMANLLVLLPAAYVAGSLLTAQAAVAASLGDVFVIDMENHNFTQPSSQTSPEQIFGNPAAPYQNSLITPGNPNSAQVSWASNYYNVLSTASGNNPHIHPSEPNYIWQEAGNNFGVLNDNDPFQNPGGTNQNAINFSGLLQNAGIPWKSYQEDIDLAKNSQGQLTSTVLPQDQWTVPLTSFSGTSADYTNPYNGSHQYNFATKHDGTLFFTDTNGGNDPTPSNPEVSHYAPLQQLATDLANNTVAPYTLITPDQFNDSHTALTNGFDYNGVHYTGDKAAIAQGDNFLSKIVPQIMASAAYKNNGAIVIWWDESEGGDDLNHTLEEIVISPLAKGNAYVSTLPYTHSSDLKSLQELFNVYAPGGGFLGDANTPGTNDLSDLFKPGALTPSTAKPVPEPSSLLDVLAIGVFGAGVQLFRKLRKSC